MTVKHILAVSLIGLLATPGLAPAQTLPSPSALRQSIDREAIRLARMDNSAATPQPAPHRSWAAQHPIELGAMIGAGAGAVWGASQCRTACEGGALTPFITAYGALLFAGVGFGIGAIVAIARH